METREIRCKRCGEKIKLVGHYWLDYKSNGNLHNIIARICTSEGEDPYHYPDETYEVTKILTHYD